MSTKEEVEETRHSRRSSGDEKSDRKKKKKIREEGELRSSREGSSSSHDTKKKKKKKEEGESSTSSRDKKKTKRSKEEGTSHRSSSRGSETADEILARLESRGTVSTGTASTEPSQTETEESTSSREKKKTKKSSKEESSSSHRSSKKSSKAKDESSSDDRSKKAKSSKDKDGSSSDRSKKHKKHSSSSKDHRHSSKSGRNPSTESDVGKKPKAARQSQDDQKGDAKVGRAGRPKMGNESAFAGDASVQIAPSSLTTPEERARAEKRRSSGTDRMFTVRKGKEDGGKRWNHYSKEQHSSPGSNQFSTRSISSGFSVPESSRALGSKGDSVRVGAIRSSHVPDRIQNMLDRKFDEFDDPRQAGIAKAAPLSPAAVGAHRETNVSDRIQNMLDQKFNEFGVSTQGLFASGESSRVLPPVHAKVQAFEPTYAQSTSETTQDNLQGSSRDDPELNQDPEEHRNIAPVERQFSMWNTGTELNSVANPSPGILANRMMDDAEMALSSVERTETRLAAGLCPDCGRTQTHEKIKYGPFQAFRKMEPLTTPGHVYKGYCLFCNNLHDLRRFLHEPYLREQDIDGTLAAPLTDSTEDDKTSTVNDTPECMEDQDFIRRKRRIQLCLCIAVLAVIAGGIGLAITFVGKDNAAATGAATPPPSPAPGPIGWHQVGSDITEPIQSFGYKVSVADNGKRVAVASPLASNTVGRVDVFYFLNTTDQWEYVGQPILGDFVSDLSGFAMDLSGDGKHLVVGYPGNGNGFVRVFRYSNGEWKQTGSTLVGENAAGWFGAAVAITPEGTHIVVGAPYDTNENGSEAGRTRVFELEDEDWVQVGSDLIGRAALDRFGTSVDLDDDGIHLAVGAPNNDDRWQDGGQVHIYQLEEDNGGIRFWKESLKSGKVLGDEEGHEFGSAMSLSGFGDTVVSSSLVATNDAGTTGGGDPRVMFITFIDKVAEELGYGFPEIPGTQGLGQAVDIDYDGTKVILSTLNLETTAGKAMLYDIQGKANWFIYSDEYGGDELGPDEWLGNGPAVSLNDGGDSFAIGYESIVVDSQTKKAAPIVRVYSYGPPEDT